MFTNLVVLAFIGLAGLLVVYVFVEVCVHVRYFNCFEIWLKIN